MADDIDLLQGTWTVTALEMDGQETPAVMLVEARIIIKGDRFLSLGMGAVYEGSLKLNNSEKHGQIDMMFDKGHAKDTTNLGIYKLDGDTWRICIATKGSVRPSKFASTPGSGLAVETLTRGGAKAKTSASKKTKLNTAPATELEGEWLMISGIFDGKPMDESMVKWVKRVTQGNETTVLAGPNVMMKAEFTIDASASPKTIGYLNKGKGQRGIYEFEGSVLKIYMAAPGSPRPTGFEEAPKKGSTLTVWKRAAERR
jgi:uncharacterized protein (TIGR03067 family)